MMFDGHIPADILSDEPFSDADLDEWLDVVAAADPDVDPTPAPGHETNPAQRWTVTDTGSAEWAMAKLAALRDHTAANDRQAAEWIARIQEWRDDQNRRAIQRATFFEALLANYTLDLRERTNDATKSITVPSGTVRTTARSAAVIVDDEDAVLAWLDDHPVIAAAAVKTERSVLVSKLRGFVQIANPDDPDSKIVTDSGEIVPGTVIQPASVTAKITTGSNE